MKTLYVFGNVYLENDSFALEIAKRIGHLVRVVHCKSPEFLLDTEENELLIMDVVKDIKKPILITDISQLKVRNLISLHDFDLGFFLNLLREIGINKKIKIIGIPHKGDIVEISEEVSKYLVWN